MKKRRKVKSKPKRNSTKRVSKKSRKPSRKRNYKAEYNRRIARGKELGLDYTVSRGHPRKGFIGIKLAQRLKLPTDLNKVGVRQRVIPVEAPGEAGRNFYAAISKLGLQRTFKTKLRAELELKLPAKVFKLRAKATDENEFIQAAMDEGLNEREAYTLWHSP